MRSKQGIYNSNGDVRRYDVYFPEISSDLRAVAIQYVGIGVKHNSPIFVERARMLANAGFVTFSPEVRGHEVNRREYRRPILDDMVRDAGEIISHVREKHPGLPVVSITDCYPSYVVLLSASNPSSKEKGKVADIYYCLGTPSDPSIMIQDPNNKFVQSLDLLRRMSPGGDLTKIKESHIPDFFIRLWGEYRSGWIKELIYVLQGEKRKRGMRVNPIRDKEAFASLYLNGPSLYPVARQIESPVVLINNKLDRLVPFDTVEKLVREFRNPESSMHVVEYKMHLIYAWIPEIIGWVVKDLEQRGVVNSNGSN